MHSKSDTQNCGHESRHNDAARHAAHGAHGAHGAHAHHDVPANEGRGERCGAHGSGHGQHGHHGQARRHHAHKSMRAYERGFEAGFAAASRLIAAA